MTQAIAHRGEPVGHRENTLPAFAAASAAGANLIELDCRLTNDDVVVVLHDPTLSRLWGVDARVADLEFTEIQALGDGDERIPTLAEALAAIDLPVMVDVDDPSVMAGALRTVEETCTLDRILFAGDLEGLSWLRGARSHARIALTWERRELPDAELLEALRPEFFNPRFDLLEDGGIKAMHYAGIGISAWTVDDEQVMRQLVERGVDAVITNRIGTLVGLLASGEATH